MTKVALFSGGDLTYFTRDFDYFVGIDKGSSFLLKNQLPLDLAIGDFDSVSAEEFKQIKAKAKKLVMAPAEKNDTDTELALKTIFDCFGKVEIIVFGAFGGRIDHMLSNIFLPSDPDLAPFMRCFKLRDEQNLVEFFPAGQHQIEQATDMVYISFMAANGAHLFIQDAKYELTEENYFQKKIYSSNEFKDKPICFSVASGYVVVIQTKDRT